MKKITFNKNKPSVVELNSKTKQELSIIVKSGNNAVLQLPDGNFNL